MKTLVAVEISKLAKNNQIIGLGTGSTVDLAIIELGKRIKNENLNLRFVCSSLATAIKAKELGIPVLDAVSQGYCDWGFDGADAVDEKRRAIKGKGGAMLKEKILAAKCKQYFLIIDETKLVNNLANTSVPIEFIKEASEQVRDNLKTLGANDIILRTGAGIYGPVITENGNFIYDVTFKAIADDLETKIKQIIGVVESGLFLNQAHKVYVGTKDQVKIF